MFLSDKMTVFLYNVSKHLLKAIVSKRCFSYFLNKKNYDNFALLILNKSNKLNKNK